MRLVQLSADRQSFHSVRFNRTGLTLIVGGRTAQARDKTTNGVGKSLLVYLIHFCLGASKRDVLAERLPDWTFSLEFEIGSQQYTAARCTSDQDVVYLNNQKLTLGQYTEWLGSQTFEIPEGTKGLTFRALIPFFIRPSREAYSKFSNASLPRNDYERLLRNAFLLGLDVGLAQTKHDLREQEAQIAQDKANFEKDQVIRDILTGGMKLELELSACAEEESLLKRRIGEFRVAEDFHEREEMLRQARKAAAGTRNKRLLISSALEQVEESLRLTADADDLQIERLYAEANAVLPERVVRRLDEVLLFHKDLASRRKTRLLGEKARLHGDLQEVDETLRSVHADIDRQMAFLGTHGALDELMAVNDHLARVTARIDKMQAYRTLLDEYSRRQSRLAVRLEEENEKVVEYLQDARDLLDGNLAVFRHLAQYIYPGRRAGVLAVNNPGDNQLRFQIDTHIEADASDGINEAKIFCYDMTLLVTRHCHSVEFVFHDSRLYSDIDPRQRARIFEAASDLATSNGLQYIATLNDDQLDGMRREFRSGFSQTIQDAIALVLSDASVEGKLLGIEIDLDY